MPFSEWDGCHSGSSDLHCIHGTTQTYQMYPHMNIAGQLSIVYNQLSQQIQPLLILWFVVGRGSQCTAMRLHGLVISNTTNITNDSDDINHQRSNRNKYYSNRSRFVTGIIMAVRMLMLR